MIAQERANRLLYRIFPSPERFTGQEIAAMIAAELEDYARERVEEIEADRNRWADSACRLEEALESFTKAKELIVDINDTLDASERATIRAEAFEEAANLGNEPGIYSVHDLAEAIRARAAEAGK